MFPDAHRLSCMTLGELDAARYEFVKKYQDIARFMDNMATAVYRAVYAKRVSETPSLYVIATARSALDIPGFKLRESDEDDETLVIARLSDKSASDDYARDLAIKLMMELTPYEAQMPDGNGMAYALTYEKACEWINVVTAWDKLNTAAPDAREKMQRRVAKKEQRAKRNEDDDYRLIDEPAPAPAPPADDSETDSADDTPSPAVPALINKAADKEEDEATKEMKQIATFFRERVVKQEDPNGSPLQKAELVGMYRIWVKDAINVHSAKRVTDYMINTMGAKTTYNGLPQNEVSFKGYALKMDDWTYMPPRQPTPASTFLCEQCVFSPTASTSTKAISEAYKKWFADNGYVHEYASYSLKMILCKELKNCPIVYNTLVRTKGMSTTGWYGVSLRSEVAAKSGTGSEGSAARSVLRKADVIQRRAPDGTVLDEWPSRAKAMENLKVGAYRLNTLISKKIADEQGAIIVCVKDGDDEATSGVRADGASTSGSRAEA